MLRYLSWAGQYGRKTFHDINILHQTTIISGTFFVLDIFKYGHTGFLFYIYSLLLFFISNQVAKP